MLEDISFREIAMAKCLANSKHTGDQYFKLYQLIVNDIRFDKQTLRQIAAADDIPDLKLEENNFDEKVTK